MRTERHAPDWLDAILARGLPPISGGDGSDDGTDGQGGDDGKNGDNAGDQGKGGKKNPLDGLTDEQHAEIRRIAAKEAKKAADAARAARDAEIAAAAEEEKKARERDEAVKAGETEKVRTSLQSEIDALTADRDAKAARLAEIDAERAKDIEEGVKAFPKDLPALAFDPGADADLDSRWRWFQTAAKQASEATKTTPRGNGRNPSPLGSGATGAEDRAAREAQERRTQRIF
jgi:hypothetical protein